MYGRTVLFTTELNSSPLPDKLVVIWELPSIAAAPPFPSSNDEFWLLLRRLPENGPVSLAACEIQVWANLYNEVEDVNIAVKNLANPQDGGIVTSSDALLNADTMVRVFLGDFVCLYYHSFYSVWVFVGW
jgi:hypothetical protein